MAEGKMLLVRQRLQWLEDFASKLEKLTIFTIIFLPKYTFFCALSFTLSTNLYRFCLDLRLKHGLKQSDTEYFQECMFWIERVAMFFLTMRYYNERCFLLWTLGLAFFCCSYAIDLSNYIGHLSHNLLLRTTINNDPSLNPRYQQGYVYWLERVSMIIVAAVPFNYLVNYYYYLALGLLLVPSILSYILKPKNNNNNNNLNNLNSKDFSEGLAKEFENREVDSKIECCSLVQYHLFWLERAAILSSILFSTRREVPIMMSGAFHLVFSFSRHAVKYGPIDPDLLFWIERAAAVFLLACGSDESSSNWYIAVVLFAITNTVYFINPIRHMLQILGSILKECEMFEGIENELEESDDDEESVEVGRLAKLEAEIKKLRSENKELKIETSLWAQELKKVTKENEETQGLMREKAENDKSLWTQEVERLKTVMREREEHELRERSKWAHQELKNLKDVEEQERVMREKEEGDMRERCLLAQELERVTEQNEENKRLMREREDIWDKKFDNAIAEHLKEIKELEAKLEEASLQAKSLSPYTSTHLRALQGRAAEMSEEVRKLKEMCKLYRGLLHDQDSYFNQNYNHNGIHYYYDHPFYYYYWS